MFNSFKFNKDPEQVNYLKHECKNETMHIRIFTINEFIQWKLSNLLEVVVEIAVNVQGISQDEVFVFVGNLWTYVCPETSILCKGSYLFETHYVPQNLRVA